jgi:hypothetical protein
LKESVSRAGSAASSAGTRVKRFRRKKSTLRPEIRRDKTR